MSNIRISQTFNNIEKFCLHPDQLCQSPVGRIALIALDVLAWVGSLFIFPIAVAIGHHVFKNHTESAQPIDDSKEAMTGDTSAFEDVSHDEAIPEELLAVERKLGWIARTAAMATYAKGRVQGKIQPSVERALQAHPSQYKTIIATALGEKTIDPTFVQEMLHRVNFPTPNEWKPFLSGTKPTTSTAPLPHQRPLRQPKKPVVETRIEDILRDIEKDFNKLAGKSGEGKSTGKMRGVVQATGRQSLQDDYKRLLSWIAETGGTLADYARMLNRIRGKALDFGLTLET